MSRQKFNTHLHKLSLFLSIYTLGHRLYQYSIPYIIWFSSTILFICFFYKQPTKPARSAASSSLRNMESLLSQFSFLSDQALQDKSFDPSTIEDLTKLFEIEAYKSWAAMELQHQNEIEEAELSMQQAEDYLESVMESAMDEFRRFEEEMENMSIAEVKSLEETAESARKMGKVMEKAATIASKRYVEAALNSATASMKSAWKGLSSNKVHPSWGTPLFVI